MQMIKETILKLIEMRETLELGKKINRTKENYIVDSDQSRNGKKSAASGSDAELVVEFDSLSERMFS